LSFKSLYLNAFKSLVDNLLVDIANSITISKVDIMVYTEKVASHL